MPMVVLHELAHAYHDRVLGFDQPDVIACYRRAKASKSYDAVRRYNGPGRPETGRAGLRHDQREGILRRVQRGLLRPQRLLPVHGRDDLERHDPEMFKLLQRLWNPPARETKPVERTKERAE